MNEASHNPASPTTVDQDVRAAVLAALMPLGGGLLLALGYAWLGFFGVILAAAADAGWAYWWRQKHGAWFPADLRTGQVGGVAVLVAVIVIFLFIAVS